MFSVTVSWKIKRFYVGCASEREASLFRQRSSSCLYYVFTTCVLTSKRIVCEYVGILIPGNFTVGSFLRIALVRSICSRLVISASPRPPSRSRPRCRLDLEQSVDPSDNTTLFSIRGQTDFHPEDNIFYVVVEVRISCSPSLLSRAFHN